MSTSLECVSSVMDCMQGIGVRRFLIDLMTIDQRIQLAH